MTEPRSCHWPRCTNPALPGGHGSCADHALARAERELERLAEFKAWVISQREGAA